MMDELGGSGRPLDVVVIGGGWSGLLMLKHALQEGLSAVALEGRDDIGGVWHFTEDPTVVTVMTTTETSSSTCFTEMADFPMPKDREFLRHDEVKSYLAAYCERFGLRPHIRFGARVRSVAKDHRAGIWEVSTETECVRARNLVVATGGHQQMNTDPLREIFAGFESGGAGEKRVFHVGELKHPPRDWAGKRVLIYGGGESSADLADLLVREKITQRVVWSMPRGQHFFRKYGFWLRKNPFTGRRLKPEAFDRQSSLIQGLMSPPYKGKSGMRWGCKWTTSGSMLAYQGHGIPEWRNDAPHMHHFVNKSANALDLIDYDKLVPKGAVAGVDGSRVRFVDGTAEDIDIVVLSTGYRPDLGYLPEPIRSLPFRDHYKFIFYNPDPTLAFAGFVRPVFGSIPIITEVQCRWIAGVFSGRHTLPDLDTRSRRTQQEAGFWRDFFKDTSGSKETLVDIFIYTLGIARVAGEFPDRKRLLREDPYLWLLSVIGPFNSVLMTLNDPAKRAHAREMLDHHRFIRSNTAATLLLQVIATLTRFDEILSLLEKAKYRLQTSHRVARYKDHPVFRAASWLLDWPKRAFFVHSAEYPWREQTAPATRLTDGGPPLGLTVEGRLR